MTTEQLLVKFNPANAGNMTAQDLLDMRNLTDQQIDALANAYPNQANRRPYLRLYDTTKADNKQLFNLSTWQNLRNVRKFSNMKNLVPYDFAASPSAFAQQQKANAGKVAGKAISSPKKVVVDLSAKEAAAELTAAISKKTAPAGSTNGNVENKAAKVASAKVENKAKPASSPKKAATNKAQVPEASNVEKSQNQAPADASEEFAPVD